MGNKSKQIIITGPEATGKTKLVRDLAQNFGFPYTEEYAVEYLDQFGPDYQYSDLLNIAKGQHKKEMQLLKKSGPPILCDTSMLVLKIWSEYRFGRCHDYIKKKLNQRKGELFLLCYPDLPWVNGPYRENPNDQVQLFQLYLNWLEGNATAFFVVKGKGFERTESAVNYLKNQINGDFSIGL